MACTAHLTYNTAMNILTHLTARVHTVFIKPRSTDPDGYRREFILNTLLTGLLLVATLALFFSGFNYFISHLGQHLVVVVQTFIFWTVMAALLLLSRLGRPLLSSMIFVAVLLLSSIQFALAWGFGIAIAELLFVMTIVIAGVLFRSLLALIASGAVAISLVVITYLQTHDLQRPSLYWKEEKLQGADIIGYLAIFIVIGLVSWLSNRETGRSLQRARRSEAALQKERDNLETKVIERTHELEELQLARLLEMQPFAEFGRIGASLVHDIANPLTAATLQVEELTKHQQSTLVTQVQRNLQQLEKYLIAARKQIKRESELRTFSVGAELRQVAKLLSHRARRNNIAITVRKMPTIRLYGDVVKFNQLVANVLANAVESYDGLAKAGNREVTIALAAEDGYATITITDHGAGIAPHNLERLFEPFYSTKSSERSGLGLGLALVKQYVQEDFKGTIAVESSRQDGTQFTIRIKGIARP